MALIERYLYLTLEKCKLYYCYDQVRGVGVSAIWDQLTAVSVVRDNFDNFCDNTAFYTESLVRHTLASLMY